MADNRYETADRVAAIPEREQPPIGAPLPRRLYTPAQDEAPTRANAGRNGRNAVRPSRSRSGKIDTAFRLNPTVPLTAATTLCYGSRLSPRIQAADSSVCGTAILRNIFGEICHELYSVRLAVMLVVTIHCVAIQASAQVYTPPLPAPAADAQGALPSSNVNERVRANRPDAPDAEHVFIESVTQEVNGPWRYLRGMVRLETTEMQLKADELDYNADTGYVEARGHVHFEHFARGEKIDCDKVEYNIEEETGKFYNVTGTAPSRIAARPGLLTTQNPFYFQSKWAERLKDHYILHDGFLTDCVLPRAWWVLRGPTFDVVPGDHATAHRSWFYLRGIRLFYAPYFYKSLKKEPRKSGFLVPNIGRSSLHGIMTGFGYYWAINRSYDLTYRGQYFSQAGLAHHAEFRGKI